MAFKEGAAMDDQLVGVLKSLAGNTDNRLTELSPSIRRLQEEGLIEVHVQVDALMLRKFYLAALTPKGRHLLELLQH